MSNVFHYFVLTVGLSLLKCISSIEKLNSEEFVIENGRLPSSLSPYHYNIEIAPDIYDGPPPFQSTGSVTIFFECLEETSQIYLNQVDVDVQNVELSLAPDSPIQPDVPGISSSTPDDDMEFFIIDLNDDLAVNAKYMVSMSFSGTLNNPAGWPSALFWDSYEEDGETKYIAGTNFYPRGWYPNFAEPSFKATFNATILRKDTMQTLLNTPIIRSEEREDGWIADIYEQTPLMSSYNLCFLIHDYEYLETTTPNGIVVRIWSRRELLPTMQYASSVAAGLQHWLDEWTGVEYPLAKLDHVTIPAMGGAMENWGLIFYGESGLALGPEVTQLSKKQSITTLIAHELAHQWYGNIVTYAWWDEVWLNEGFATFFQFMPLEDELGWTGNELQLSSSGWNIMNTDSTNRTEPVRKPVISPWQAGGAFSGQAYNKGGCIVRMIRQILGEETFKSGINRYLNDHLYGNAETQGLWASLEEQAAIDGITDTDGAPLVLSEKLDPWVNQNGYPVVSVSNLGDGTLSFSQEQFQNPRGAWDMPDSPWNYTWNVPITMTSSDNPDFTTLPIDWMDREDKIISAEIPEDGWLMVNNLYGGYFLVQYDLSNFLAISQQLITDHMVIPSENRGQFLRDTFRLAEAGYINDVYTLEPTQYLGNEEDYLAWQVADAGLQYSSLVLQRYESTAQALQIYMSSLLAPLYSQLGWDMNADDSALQENMLRVLIMRQSCENDVADCGAQSQTIYTDWMNEPQSNRPDASIRPVIVCNGVSQGSDVEFSFALEQYLQVADVEPNYLYSSERATFIQGMACASDTDILNEYINLAFDSQVIRVRDRNSVMTAISQAKFGRWVMWEHLKNNWDDNPTPPGVSRGSVLQSVVSGFASQQDLEELEAFIEMYPPENDVDIQVYQSAMSTVNANIGWAEENQQDFFDWLGRHVVTSVTIE